MFGLFKQKQIHKSNGVKTTKITNKKTGKSKIKITRSKPKTIRKRK